MKREETSEVPNGPTAQLAEFASETKFGSLPKSVVETAKMAVFDSVGCSFFGASLPWVEKVARYVKKMNGRHTSVVWWKGFKAPPAEAALVNGTMVHSYELDDVFAPGKLHPGATVIPSAFAAAEMRSSSGTAFLTAMVLGYEVACRLGLALNPIEARKKGWHITGIVGTIGAAAAVSRLLDLDQQTTANALGLAGTQAAGLWAFTADDSWSKRFHAGRAAQAGVTAALLADIGFRGPTKILEAKDGGLLNAFSSAPHPALAVEGLGSHYVMEDVGFKLHACCGSVHSALDAVARLMEEHDFAADDVKSVNVFVSSVVGLQCGFEYVPMGVLQAQMSLKFCVAAMLLEGVVSPAQFRIEMLRDPRVVALARKIVTVRDSDIESLYPRKMASKVDLILRDGSIFSDYIEEPRGLSAANPVSWGDLEAKFDRLTRAKKEHKRNVSVAETVRTLDSKNSLSALKRLLSSMA